MNKVSIGCFSAFWGDSPHAFSQFISSGEKCPNYLVGDYLSEVTMAILAKMQNATKIGYVPEFVQILTRDLWGKWPESLKAIIVNAGGLDPLGLKQAIDAQQNKLTQNSGIQPQWRIAAVFGDDMRNNLLVDKWKQFTLVDESSMDGEDLKNQKKWLSVNVYFGSRGIVKALECGANIILTGRCVDSALVVGPLVSEFGWDWKNYDALASASLAGHIIECGCQCTGGNFTDWTSSLNAHTSGWKNVGFPIIEFEKDLSFIVSKLPETGGIINAASVAEQILYEIQDPSRYILPDVVVDFTQIQLKEIGRDRVRVWGAKGKPPTNYLKICATYSDKYKIEGLLMIGGIDASAKARAVGKAIIERSNELLQEKYGMDKFSDTHIEVLGAEDTYGSYSQVSSMTREVVLRIVVVHPNPKALKIFSSEIASSATSMAPGIMAVGSGRPKEQPLIQYAAFLINRVDAPSESIAFTDSEGKLKTVTLPPTQQSSNDKQVHPENTIHDDTSLSDASTSSSEDISEDDDDISTDSDVTEGDTIHLPVDQQELERVTVPLFMVCHARSGDKGPVCNIGIRCRYPRLFPILSEQLTPEKMKESLQHLQASAVQRYTLPGLHSWNFLVGSILGGGGLSSLRIDRQGKAIAQQCLTTILVEIPASILREVLQESKQHARVQSLSKL